MNNLTKGDFVKHNIYGKGIITNIYKNPLGQTCYEVYFKGLAKRVTVMDKSSLKPDYSPIQEIVDSLGLRHKSSEDALDYINSLLSIISDNDGNWKTPTSKTEKEKAEESSAAQKKDIKDNSRETKKYGIATVKRATEEELPLYEERAKESKETVNHPSHYNTGKIEVIDYIESLGLGVGFNLGNAIKYISRAGYKPGNGVEQDIKKALWYIERQEEAWSNTWAPFVCSSKKKIGYLDYIEDKQLSYCFAGAIDHIYNSLTAETKNDAVWNLIEARHSLQYWLDHYCSEGGDK